MTDSRGALRLLLFLSLISFSGWCFGKPSILIIESYHKEYPWDQSYLEGLREQLDDDYRLSTFEMDTKRLPKSAYQAQADKAWQVFIEQKPDLVILGDDNALKYLGKKINETKTPTVFLGINGNPRDIGLPDMPYVTGVLERPLFKRNIIELNKIMNGKLKRLLVLFDSGNTSRAAVDEAFKGQKTLRIQGTTATLELVATREQWQEIIRNAPQHYDAVIVGLYHTLVDASGQHVPANEILEWTSQHSQTPTFAFWDFAVGKGKTAGGLVLFGKIQGLEAAKIVKRVMAGEDISKIRPVTAKNGRYYFSKSELDRWGLTLPQSIANHAVLTE
ncbi:MAG: ABC transporter substrate binding protein [Oleiphilaceae bacterium]|nr:ABC transporter substrate binding protein [Oleiphilaceae bacterium]